MTTTRRVAAVLFPLCVLAGNSTAGTIIDLGTFGGFTSYATGISANGKVTGAADLADGTTHAFLYSGGSKIDLGALGTGQNSVGTSVNSAGVVTGSSGDTTSSTAIEYSGGTLSAMGVVPANSVGKAINENGEVAGVTGFSDPGYNSRGFLYTGGQLVTLNPYGGGRELTTTGLNNSGEVVGYERGANFYYQAFSYLSGAFTPLQGLGGNISFANGVNDNGEIVGYATLSGDSQYHAFTNSSAGVADIGTLGGADSEALALSQDGHVVGSAEDQNGTKQAFVYYPGGMTDLNTLISPSSGWHLDFATGINDAGQIVGSGTINGERHAYLLQLSSTELAGSSAPEPGTWGLVAAGLLVLAIRRIR